MLINLTTVDYCRAERSPYGEEIEDTLSEGLFDPLLDIELIARSIFFLHGVVACGAFRVFLLVDQ